MKLIFLKIQFEIKNTIDSYSNAEKNKEIVPPDKILNSSNRHLKMGDDGTLKGEDRHHTRVKILCLSKLNNMLLCIRLSFLLLRR